MCIEAYFCIELALIEYFINELLLILIIWMNHLLLNIQKISYYFIVKFSKKPHTITSVVAS
jgi:hypothetical protein